MPAVSELSCCFAGNISITFLRLLFFFSFLLFLPLVVVLSQPFFLLLFYCLLLENEVCIHFGGQADASPAVAHSLAATGCGMATTTSEGAAAAAAPRAPAVGR